MTYLTVDKIQKQLSEDIFGNRKESKKASGRALGTIIELITFYIFKGWGFLPNLSIERKLKEFGNDEITHNVEYGLHQIVAEQTITLDDSIRLPLTSAKLFNLFNLSKKIEKKTNQLLTSDFILRNSCLIGEDRESIFIANIDSYDGQKRSVKMTQLKTEPFSMVECKRVGIEEGAKKGPTTIEKAKQGAYVATKVSSLQKIRNYDGKEFGVIPLKNGEFEFRELNSERKRIIHDMSLSEFKGFILTIGVVSNHGNWFTKDNMNKELLVLKQSYDWLLFLTDLGISSFLTDTILSKSPQMKPVRDAFEKSYVSGISGKNQFTKVKINFHADQVLNNYFLQKLPIIEQTWFEIITPYNSEIIELKKDLEALANKK
jgi:hypothetical protein